MVLKKYQPYLAMLFVQILYAGMALFSKASISNGMNPYIFVVYRQAFATLSLAPFAIFLERSSNFHLLYVYIICIYVAYLYIYTLEYYANMFVMFFDLQQQDNSFIHFTSEDILYILIWVWIHPFSYCLYIYMRARMHDEV